MNIIPFFLVWNPQRGIPDHKHATEGEANIEADRLAREHPEEEFFVLSVLRRAKTRIEPVEWTQVLSHNTGTNL